MVRITRPRTLHECHDELGGRVLGRDVDVSGITSLTRPVSGSLAFCRTELQVKGALSLEPLWAALLVPEEAAPLVHDMAPVWIHLAPLWVVACLLDDAEPVAPAIVDPSAVIHPSAVVYPGVTVGAGVTIGAYAVIGQPGFGFARSPEGQVRSIPHVAGVKIGDRVSIAAHVTVDAGMLEPTVLEDDVHIDSHVHIGHNARIGRGTVICAQVGLAGSVDVGPGVQIGGQAGIADHIRIGAGARIAAKSGVIGDVAANVTVAGYPAVPRMRWLRGHASLYREVRGRS